MHLCILAAGVMETNLGGEALLEIIKVRSIIWRGLSSFSVHERQQRHTSFDDCQGGKNLLAMAAFISEATVLFHHVSFTLEAFFKFKVCANPTLVKADV